MSRQGVILDAKGQLMVLFRDLERKAVKNKNEDVIKRIREEIRKLEEENK